MWLGVQGLTALETSYGSRAATHARMLGCWLVVKGRTVPWAMGLHAAHMECPRAATHAHRPAQKTGALEISGVSNPLAFVPPMQSPLELHVVYVDHHHLSRSFPEVTCVPVGSQLYVYNC